MAYQESRFAMWKTVVLCVALGAAVEADKLVIEKIECKRVATGIDNWSKAGIAAVGGFIAGGAVMLIGGTTVVATGGAAVGTIPVTLGAVAGAAASGSSAAVAALTFMDGPTSGQDDLIVNVNGKKVIPSSGNYKAMEAGDIIYPEVSVDFDKGCEIQLIEWDSWSDDDDMGSIRVNSDANDKTAKGKNYRVEAALMMSVEEGSVYLVTYRVEKVSSPKVSKWALCGTNACKDCPKSNCDGTNNDGLDRDGDKEDLRACPYPMVTSGWKEYPQYWPFDDVYLRICKHPSYN